MEKVKNRKKTILHAAICVGLLCVIWGGYVFGMRGIIEVVEDDFSWVYQVDAVETEGTQFQMHGFAFKIRIDAEPNRYEIVLKEISSGKKYFAKMKYEERADVDDYFRCEYDYLKSGFTAVFNREILSLQEKDYEVLLRVKGKKTAYKTGTFISKGELMYANPKEFKTLDVAGTELEEIVTNGVLRVYRPDYGMYVYQYGGELYWIAEKSYGFVEGDTYVQYHLDTTQVDKLPENRLSNKWYWDNIGFWFGENELFDDNNSKYRVTKKRIPTEYSVMKIWTGNYINNWIWRQDFRPYFYFE